LHKKSDKELSNIIKYERQAAQSRIHYKSNPNTTNYDIKYHRLKWTVNPNVSPASITGNVTTYWEANEPMSTITFDLKDNINVLSIIQRGASLAFTHTDDEVLVTLPTTQNTGVLDSLTINYEGNPTSTGFGSFEQDLHDGIPIIFTYSQPYGAMDWWPCKQDLNDKIDSIDVFVTHPRFYSAHQEYKTASNGVLVSEIITGANKTTHWKHRYPIPAYLIAITVTNYAVYDDIAYEGTTDEFPISNYVYPEDLSSAQANTPITTDIMEVYGDLFGMYPYADEKYGHAQISYGGMEHTTMSFMGVFNQYIIAHELAHQWFGDKVTCGSWRDIWLNEGFATYLNGITYEHLDGEEAFKIWREGEIDFITPDSDGSVYCTDTTDIFRIFDGRLSYSKGAMVLHMLRYKIGDTDFFQGINNYLNDPDLAFGYAKTIDLQNHLEAQSGIDLDEYFADWFMGGGYPSYQIEWNQSGSDLFIRVNQTQSHASVSYFEMPVPIKIIDDDGHEHWLRLENTENEQLFIQTVPYAVNSVAFDPDSQLITKDNTVTINPGLNVLDASTVILTITNPVKDQIAIHTTNEASIIKTSIFNNLGQKIFEKNNSNSVLYVSHLDSGVILLHIMTDKGTFIQKLVKE